MKKIVSLILATVVFATLTTVALAATVTTFAWKDGMNTCKKSSGPASQIRLIQWSLYKQGYLSGLPDGIFGSGTDGAVKNFQADFSLTADGIVGPTTWNTLQNRNILSYTSISGYQYYLIGSDSSSTRHFCAWKSTGWRVLKNDASGYDDVTN